MNKNYYIFANLIAITTFLPVLTYQMQMLPYAMEKTLMQQIVSYQGPKTFLLSYPRSGNTWMRYCLEYLTQRPTFHQNYQNSINKPLAWRAQFEIDCEKAPIEKVHILEGLPYDKSVDKLILLVRNPKEAIKRHEKKIITYDLLKISKLYFTDISIYDSWDPQNRILIYYEDFIKNPESTLRMVCNFLNEPVTKLADFMNNYEKHQKTAIGLYGESRTQGKDLLAHSREMGPELCRKADAWIEELYPEVWHKYLKDRYREDVLDYSQ
jgi:hypothetical protein